MLDGDMMTWSLILSSLRSATLIRHPDSVGEMVRCDPYSILPLTQYAERYTGPWENRQNPDPFRTNAL